MRLLVLSDRGYNITTDLTLNGAGYTVPQWRCLTSWFMFVSRNQPSAIKMWCTFYIYNLLQCHSQSKSQSPIAIRKTHDTVCKAHHEHCDTFYDPNLDVKTRSTNIYIAKCDAAMYESHQAKRDAFTPRRASRMYRWRREQYANKMLSYIKIHLLLKTPGRNGPHWALIANHARCS